VNGTTPPANCDPAVAARTSLEQWSGARAPWLDVLRGAAVLLVLGRHIGHPPQLPEPLQTVVGGWYRCGWVGVDLFFVLSGFLVSGLVFAEWQRTGGFAAGRFLIRRGFKIYPAFYLLWFLVLLEQWISGRGFDVARLLSEFLFLQNYWPPEWSHTWSLAVEEHFYLGLALLCWLRVRHRVSGTNPFLPVVGLGAALLILCPALRWQASAGGTFDLMRVHFPTHLRVDSLMFGVITSWFWTFRRRPLEDWVRPRRGPLAILGLALLLPTVVCSLEQDRWLHVIGFSLFALAGSLVIGMVMGRLIEWPMLKLRDRWFPSIRPHLNTMPASRSDDR